MTLDYSEANIVKINMTHDVRKILDEAPKEMDGTAPSPAADYVFRIVDGIELLDSVKSESFHGTVAKLLFLYASGQTFKPGSPFCAHESNNQLSMTSTSFPE
jgi:hypothetical protein